LQSVLGEWISVTEELAANWSDKNDVPWWYNERANLSVLAGGVWRSGGCAFEEFSETKRRAAKANGRFKGSYPGRVDLYFSTKSGEEFNLESKACESGALKAKHNPQPRIDMALQAACKDIRILKPNGTRKLGAVFVKPYIENRPSQDLHKIFTGWIGKLEGFDCDAKAWVFPKNFSCGKSERWICPGVVLLIREIKA